MLQVAELDSLAFNIHCFDQFGVYDERSGSWHVSLELGEEVPVETNVSEPSPI